MNEPDNIISTFVNSQSINIIDQDFDSTSKITKHIDSLIFQGTTLTNEHVILHQVTSCDCVEYNIKIKIINKLINMLRKVKSELTEEAIRRIMRISTENNERASTSNNNIYDILDFQNDDLVYKFVKYYKL